MDASGNKNLTTSEQGQLDGVLLTLRIIAGALIMGVVTTASILTLLAGGDLHTGFSILVWLALGITIFSIIASTVAPPLMTRRRPSGDFRMEPALAIYSTRVVMGFAILEGAAFLNVIVFFVEGNWLLLAATGLLILLMFAKFPSRGRIVRWIEERKQLSQLGGGRSE